MTYPADNPVTRLDALYALLDAVTTRAERDALYARIRRLRNGVSS